MGRFFKLILQLVGSAVIIFMFTIGLVCMDGLIDQGEKADAALVLGGSQATRRGSDPMLDRVVKRYSNGDFVLIIVNDFVSRPTEDQGGLMVSYLEKHGVDPGAIVQLHSGDNVPVTARQVVSIMKNHQLQSVMLIADYYRITRMKIALYHEGISAIDKSHVGTFRQEDLVDVAHEVIALYDYVARAFVFPTAEKLKNEAQVEMDKAKADAAKTKDKAAHSLDTLPK
jgi:hypothetical protein